MNYLKQITAFSIWKEVNPIPATAIALWHELMAINNRHGWASEFTVPNGLLQVKAGLSRKQLDAARIILINKGLITYRKSTRVNQAGTYSLLSVPIVSFGQQEEHVTGNEWHTEGTQEEHERGTLFKHKQKHNNNARDDFVQILETYTEVTGRQEQYMTAIERGEARRIAESGIPLDFILQTMKQTAVGKKVNSFKFFAKVIPDMWARLKSNVNETYDYNRTRIAFSKFVNDGGDPDDFDWSKQY